MGYPHVEKKCGDCKTFKPVDEFYPSNQGTHRRDGYCKVCRRRRNRADLDRRNKVVLRLKAKDPHYYRRKKLMRMYGITQEQFEEMHAAQGGVCAICRQPETRILYGNPAHLVVDHDHATGKVRGLLCCSCNGALAAIENKEFLSTAQAYLQAYQ